MQGTRIYSVGDDLYLKPGEYGIHPIEKVWHACTPNGLYGSLANHDVVEHDDGTITVSPSILVTGWDGKEGTNHVQWHGYLEHGVWRQIYGNYS